MERNSFNGWICMKNEHDICAQRWNGAALTLETQLQAYGWPRSVVVLAITWLPERRTNAFICSPFPTCGPGKNADAGACMTAVSNLAYYKATIIHALQIEEALAIWRELGAEGKAGAAYTMICWVNWRQKKVIMRELSRCFKRLWKYIRDT